MHAVLFALGLYSPALHGRHDRPVGGSALVGSKPALHTQRTAASRTALVLSAWHN
jgi:hypothetical protein